MTEELTENMNEEVAEAPVKKVAKKAAKKKAAKKVEPAKFIPCETCRKGAICNRMQTCREALKNG